MGSSLGVELCARLHSSAPYHCIRVGFVRSIANIHLCKLCCDVQIQLKLLHTCDQSFLQKLSAPIENI